MTFIKRPLTWSPAGIVMGVPCDTASMPRLQSVGRVHRYGTDGVFPDVLLNFDDQDLSVWAGNLHGVVDTGEGYLFLPCPIIKVDIHYRADNL